MSKLSETLVLRAKSSLRMFNETGAGRAVNRSVGSKYFWLGVLPLALAGELFGILRNVVSGNHEKLIEHLLPEGIGLLVGIPLVYLIVESTLQMRESAEWAFGEKELVRRTLELSTALSRYVLAVCARHMASYTESQDLAISLAGSPSNIARSLKDFLFRRDALVNSFQRYSSRLSPEMNRIFSLLEDKTMFFGVEDFLSAVTQTSSAFFKSSENLIYLDACNKLSGVLHIVGHVVNSVFGEGTAKTAETLEETAAMEHSPFESFSKDLIAKLDPREEWSELQKYGFNRAHQLREFDWLRLNVRRCQTLLNDQMLAFNDELSKQTGAFARQEES